VTAASVLEVDAVVRVAAADMLRQAGIGFLRKCEGGGKTKKSNRQFFMEPGVKIEKNPEGFFFVIC